jgi:diguanylate cyclase (GGDEF)-like protein
VARDGFAALHLHQDERADVILANGRMPRLDGVELCRRARATDGDDEYTYFILMTPPADREYFERGMDAGADDYHAKPIDDDELEARLLSAGRVLSLYRKLSERNSALRRDSQTSFRQARTDALTGVANRLRLTEDLEKVWASARRYGRRYSVALADIDLFKLYNDTFGHVAGDGVLHDVAQSMRSLLRQSDALYRYGGEEFMILLPEQSLDDAARAMERVRSGIERLQISAPESVAHVVTVSIGVAELASGDSSASHWIERVDAALYRAKAEGRNRVALAEAAA